MNEKGLMISVSGPSGVGKGTIIEEIRRMFPECKHSISVTTRPPRGEEQDGVEYYFRTKDEFEKLVKEGEIIEYDMYVDNYYGTPATPLIEKSNRGDDVLLDITIAGRCVKAIWHTFYGSIKRRIISGKTDKTLFCGDKIAECGNGEDGC